MNVQWSGPLKKLSVHRRCVSFSRVGRYRDRAVRFDANMTGFGPFWHVRLYVEGTLVRVIDPTLTTQVAVARLATGYLKQHVDELLTAKKPRTVQCAKCPWKKSTNPRDIPNGYCEDKHKALKSTIAQPGMFSAGPLRMMACHESKPGAEEPCVGWVVNQLGPGNNMGLRMMALDGRFKDYRVVGEQHERFEDTLPTCEEE